MTQTQQVDSWIGRLDATGWPALAGRWVVGISLVAMSLAKIKDPVGFLKLVDQYQMISAEGYRWLNFVTIVIPWVELVGGVLLIIGLGLKGVALVLLVMLGLFTGVVGLRTADYMRMGQKFFEVQFDCGCGAGVQVIWIKLLENLGLMLLLLWVFLARTARLSLDAAFKPASSFRKVSGHLTSQ